MRNAREYNFDGLVGPSHNYAGLSFGNVASFSNVRSASNPRLAALQGLAKMRDLAARGFAQAVMPHDHGHVLAGGDGFAGEASEAGAYGVAEHGGCSW